MVLATVVITAVSPARESGIATEWGIVTIVT